MGLRRFASEKRDRERAQRWVCVRDRERESSRWVCVGLRRRREIERELGDGFVSEIERERARDGSSMEEKRDLEMGRQWRRRESSRSVVYGGEERARQASMEEKRAREASSIEEKRELEMRQWRRREVAASIN